MKPVRTSGQQRGIVVMLGVGAATVLLVLVAWATSSAMRVATPATGPASTGSAPNGWAPIGVAPPSPTGHGFASSPAGSASTVDREPATTSTAPAPFIQNFGPPAGTPLPPVASPPTAPVPFPVGDGCDHGYGDPNQCVPVHFPPGVTDACAWLRAHGFGPLAVHGLDRLGLDLNRDGVACGPGDG